MKRRIPWQDADFYDEQALDKEIRRVFDICHGCRRCFNLCSLFPKLFDIMDSPEVDGDVQKLTEEHIKEIIPECTLCDMCYINKCPYVPPHPWNVDFPRLILRYRAIQAKKKKGLKDSYRRWVTKQMATVDRYGPIASSCAPLANKALACSCLRKASGPIIGVDAKARLPRFRKPQLIKTWHSPPPNPQGPAYGQKAWLYLTCFSNYYESKVAIATAKILAHLGVEVHARYPGCCGMPLWEQGQLDDVIKQAKQVAAVFKDADIVIPLTPSCTFMLKSEWPALCPEDEAIVQLGQKTKDLSEYGMTLARSIGWKSKKSFPEGVAVHMACHVRAQNVGNKSYEWLAQLPHTPVHLIERCSGHGGIWGYMKTHFKNAITMGKGVVRQTKDSGILVTECPLARQHLEQITEISQRSVRVCHPIELIAESLFEEDL